MLHRPKPAALVRDGVCRSCKTMPSSSSFSGTHSNLSRNLRVLAERSPTVAEFCRSAGFNRQQFNKYLAGTHAPSQRSLVKIADYCGLGSQDLLLPPSTFVSKLERRTQTEGQRLAHPHFQKLETLATSSSSSLRPFIGTYHRYYYSSIYSGRLVRAVARSAISSSDFRGEVAS